MRPRLADPDGHIWEAVHHPRASPVSEADTRRAIGAIWHLEAARVIGRAARLVRDVGLAEISPGRAGGRPRWDHWLMTATRRPAPRRPRRRQNREIGAEPDFQHALASEEQLEAIDARLDDDIGDDRCASSSPPAIRCCREARFGAFDPCG